MEHFAMHPALLLSVLFTLAPSVPAPTTAQGDDHPRPPLSGAWVLNTDKTEGQRTQFSRGMGRQPGGRGGEQPPDEFGGGFGMRNMGGDPGLTELLRAKTRLDITVTDTLVTVADDAGWIREMLPDQGAFREELGQGGPAEVETRWKGDKLVTVRKLDRGGEFKETYSFNTKARQLVVETSFTTERMPRAIEARRVYDPVPPGP